MPAVITLDTPVIALAVVVLTLAIASVNVAAATTPWASSGGYAVHLLSVTICDWQGQLSIPCHTSTQVPMGLAASFAFHAIGCVGALAVCAINVVHLKFADGEARVTTLAVTPLLTACIFGCALVGTATGGSTVEAIMRDAKRAPWQLDAIEWGPGLTLSAVAILLSAALSALVSSQRVQQWWAASTTPPRLHPAWARTAADCGSAPGPSVAALTAPVSRQRDTYHAVLSTLLTSWTIVPALHPRWQAVPTTSPQPMRVDDRP